MRVPLAVIGMLLVVTTAYAQSPCAAEIPAYDPYKPSDLAIMREYGGTVLAQAPLSTLLKLDPYVPSQGELLRQLGRAIPIWSTFGWYPHAGRPIAADCQPAVRPASTAAAAAPISRFSDVLIELQRRGVEQGSARITPSSGAAAGARAGVSIRYADRTWVSDGPAVPYSATDFVRLGESAGHAVYGRAGAPDDVIFLPTSSGMVAPFRAAR